MPQSFFPLLICTLLAWPVLAGADETKVTVLKTPGGGIQPQALVDEHGTLHLLYYQGEARAGNLMYVRRPAGKLGFSEPLRVNSQQGSAIAAGTMRGGQIALGRNGRVHVVWNGSTTALPKNPIAGTPMLYARLDDAGTAFQPQRNLMTRSAVLDGGGTLAADRQGHVYVAWHALGQELVKGEDNRKVWVAISHDDGQTFAAEKPAWQENTGACGCCGMRGFADLKGQVHFLYRAASDRIERGMYWIRSADGGKSFVGAALDQWKIPTCPMSSAAFAAGPGGLYAAWDTDGQIYVSRLQPGKTAPDAPRAVPGTGGHRKHPALAVSKNGEVLLAWTEGTGWNRGGSLAWQIYDEAGNSTASGRRAEAIPVWGLPAVVANVDGGFTIWH